MCCAFVLTLKQDRFPSTELEEIDATKEKSLACQGNTKLISEIHQKFCEDGENPVREDFGKSRIRLDNADAEIIRHAQTSTYYCRFFAYADFSNPFLLATDAFSAESGAVL